MAAAAAGAAGACAEPSFMATVAAPPTESTPKRPKLGQAVKKLQAGQTVKKLQAGAHGAKKLQMQTPGGKKFADIVKVANPRRKSVAHSRTPQALAKKMQPLVTKNLDKIEAQKEEEEQGCCGRCLNGFGKVYRKLHIQYLGFLLVLVLYALLGAGIFYGLEYQNEQNEKTDTKKQLNDSVYNLTDEIFRAGANRAEIRRILKNYQKEAGLFPDDGSNWDFWGSMFYSATLFTTIGYGHYAPGTTGGRIATMVYAIIGIPLVLATLADLGRVLAKLFKHLWTKLRRLFKKARAKLHDKKFKKGETYTEEWKKWLESEEFNLPISVALFILFGWIFLSAAVFCIWEEWTYFKSCYFTFISLTTIGLGDVTPDYPKIMMANFPIILVGLALVSMVINVIQNEINELKESSMDFLEDELGWDTESESDDDGGIRRDSGMGMPTSLGIIQTWSKSSQDVSNAQKAADVLMNWKKTAKRRKRRGVQTDESWMREAKKKHPHMHYLEMPPDHHKSRDDVNSLIEELDIAAKLTTRSQP